MLIFLLIKCSKNDVGDSSEQNTIASEDGENVFKNSVSQRCQKKDGAMVMNVGDLIPDGKVKTSDIKLSLAKDSQVELKFKYIPTDNYEGS